MNDRLKQAALEAALDLIIDIKHQCSENQQAKAEEWVKRYGHIVHDGQPTKGEQRRRIRDEERECEVCGIWHDADDEFCPANEIGEVRADSATSQPNSLIK